MIELRESPKISVYPQMQRYAMDNALIYPVAKCQCLEFRLRTIILHKQDERHVLRINCALSITFG